MNFSQKKISRNRYFFYKNLRLSTSFTVIISKISIRFTIVFTISVISMISSNTCSWIIEFMVMISIASAICDSMIFCYFIIFFIVTIFTIITIILPCHIIPPPIIFYVPNNIAIYNSMFFCMHYRSLNIYKYITTHLISKYLNFIYKS